MILTQFTKGNNKRNNKIYRICGWTMFFVMALVVASYFLPVPSYMTMIYEFVLLEAFSVAWIVKSGAFFQNQKLNCTQDCTQKTKKHRKGVFLFLAYPKGFEPSTFRVGV